MMFSDGLTEVVTKDEELQALTLDDFSLEDFTGIGVYACGAGLLVSLLVLGVISILRTR